MRCASCGRKCLEIGSVYTKHIGAQTVYKCAKCDTYWVADWDEFEQTETISRGDRELCEKFEAKMKAEEKAKKTT